TKAHLQRTGTGLETISWSSLAPPEGGGGGCQVSGTHTYTNGRACTAHSHTFSGLALGLNPSAGARWHLQRGCEVFDRCPTKAHLQRTGTDQLELVGTSRGGVRCLTGVRQRHTFSGLALSSWSSLAPPEGV